ncbi:MAG TPA: hypothetical protein VM076_08025 [Gemmatimonadaceae bacterium]|nr:hypothetical protein [Gemmatimonadaceae bacterium]
MRLHVRWASNVAERAERRRQNLLERAGDFRGPRLFALLGGSVGQLAKLDAKSGELVNEWRGRVSSRGSWDGTKGRFAYVSRWRSIAEPSTVRDGSPILVAEADLP